MKLFFSRNKPLLSLRQENWIQAIVIASILLIAAYIGLRPQSRIAFLPSLAALGLLGLIVLLRKLPWGIIALVPIAFLVDIRFGTGTNVSFNVTFLFSIALIGIWFIKMIVIDREVRLIPSAVNTPALLFVVSGILSWFTSFLPWLPMSSGRPSIFAQAGAFSLYALSIGLLLMVFNIITERRHLEIFTWLYILLGTFYAAAYIIVGNSQVINRWLVDEHFGNSIYWTLLTAITLGQVLFNHNLSRLIRALMLLIPFGIVGYELLLRPEWVSGWLPLIIAVSILLWLKNWRYGIPVTIGAIIFFLPTFTSFINSQVNTEIQQWSTFTRFATWPIIFNLIKINPITGLGPAVYPYMTSLYFYLGYYVPFNTHNNYFDIILQMGLIGFGIFVWLIIVILRICGHLIVKIKMHKYLNSGFDLAYSNALLAALIAILISGTMVDWFLPFLYNIGIPGFQASIFLWLFVGGLISLDRVNSIADRQRR